MIEDVLGRTLDMLPLEVIIFLSITMVLWRTGTLERTAKSINLWLRAMINAEKARKEFQQQVYMRELDHEDKVDEITTRAVTQAQATYSLEQSRLRQQLLEMTASYITYLESELSKYNDFMRSKNGVDDDPAGPDKK